MKKELTYFILLLYMYSSVSSTSVHIPNHLLECYRNNATEIQNRLKIPMTTKLLIELLQKVETSKYLDMRLLTTSTLYRMKFDGIQRVSDQEEQGRIPVGPTAKHFNKFHLIMNYLLSGDETQFPNESLTKEQFCSLHLMVSSSVQSWERGDEAKTCPQVKMLPNDSPWQYIWGKQKSVCPIEMGVIMSEWGPISGGYLLIAAAAALQSQTVKFMEIINAIEENEHIETINVTTVKNAQNGEISNLWAATLAGNLAEVVTFQQMFVDKLIIGTSGMWNDSLLPRVYYLPDSIGSHWEMTLAEILGGIDGVIIGTSLNDWVSKMGRLRLSQVLDMYYSRYGVNFDLKYRACERRQNIKELLKTVDLVAQTTTMTNLLQHYFLPNPAEEWVYVPDEYVQMYAQNATNTFIADIDSLTSPNSACEKRYYNIQPADIFVVMDGTWSEYDGRRFITSLCHMADVSLYGSRVGFINGHNGAWMTNVTHQIYQIFEDLSRKDLPWPTSLSTSSSLTSVIEYLRNKSLKECIDKSRSTRNSVIIMLTMTSTINSMDLNNSHSLINTVKTMNPATRIIYVTSNENPGNYDQLDDLARNEYANDVVLKTSYNPIGQVVQAICEQLEKVPAQIVEMHCDTDVLEYEDYITPKVTTNYEIPYTIMRATNGGIRIEFNGYDYGNMSVCICDKARPDEVRCEWIDSRHQSVQFTTKDVCRQHENNNDDSNDYGCTVQFKVKLHDTRHKCTDDECRYPDQARIEIRTTLPSRSSTLTTTNVSLLLLMLTVCLTETTSFITLT